jgi:DNA-binding transcriptional ArsR family regulator
MKSLKPKQCSQKLRALGDPERLRIIQFLATGPRCVGELAELLQKPIPAVSHHLQRLRQANLVEAERRGKFIYYCLNPKVYQRANDGACCDYLNLGCCRLELPQEK